MKPTTYAGIDYGIGKSNISESGIRYGVIAENSINPECVEDIYHGPHSTDLAYEQWQREIEAKVKSAVTAALDDYMSTDDAVRIGDEAADAVMNGDRIGDVYQGDETIPHYDDGEYVIGKCLQSDLVITKSPFITFAQFCSPCVPGACNLDSPIAWEGECIPETVPTDNACYCLGHEWFEGGKAPYRLFNLGGAEILPESTTQ